MNAVDTNVLVYRLDEWEPIKQATAKALLDELADEEDTLLLWQTLGELINQLTRWHYGNRIGRDEITKWFSDTRELFPLVMPRPQVLDIALDLASRYSLSHWDSMLLGACIDAGVTTLYTEDIGSPRKIESLELVNPF